MTTRCKTQTQTCTMLCTALHLLHAYRCIYPQLHYVICWLIASTAGDTRDILIITQLTNVPDMNTADSNKQQQVCNVCHRCLSNLEGTKFSNIWTQWWYFVQSEINLTLAITQPGYLRFCMNMMHKSTEFTEFIRHTGTDRRLAATVTGHQPCLSSSIMTINTNQVAAGSWV